MVIGVIGKIGCGKSTCVNYIRDKYDAVVFSCDDIAKEMIANKEVDYEIGDPVEFFTNENKQEECRQKVHKPVFLRISKNICEQKAKNPGKTFVIESALPGEELYEICDKVICIKTAFDKNVERLSTNRNYTFGKTKLIYDSQKYYEKFYDRADYTIENDGDMVAYKKKVEEVVDEICVVCK